MDIEFLVLLATKSGLHKIRMSGKPTAPISEWTIQAWLAAHLTEDGLPGGSLAAPPDDFHVDFYPIQAVQKSVLDNVEPISQDTKFRALSRSPVLIGVCSDVDSEISPVLTAVVIALKARQDEDVQSYLQQRVVFQQLDVDTPSPCERFREASEFVGKWLDRQPSVKEESLTDWLLYEVSEKLSFVVYRAFTRHQEARETGADWEWWILFRDQYLRLRVQAKKVFSSKDNYPHLAHTNRYGLQIDMLLDDARKVNAIPLYALYTSEIHHTMCDEEPRRHHEGVFFAGANRINSDFISGGRRSISTSDLLAISNPFSCFACCPLLRDSPPAMLKFIEQFYPSEVRPDPDNIDGRRGVHSELPSYVTSLLELASVDLPDGWEREFERQLDGLGGVLIYDYRD